MKKALRRFWHLIRYGFILDYHLSKQRKYNAKKHPTVLRYHYEKSCYYYDKIYDNEA